MPVIRSQRAIAGFTVLDTDEDLLPHPKFQDCLPVAALRQRAWLQVSLVTLVLLMVGGQLMSAAEFENEHREASEYSDLLDALERLVHDGHLNRSQVDTIHKFAQRTSAAPQFEDVSEADVNSHVGGSGRALVANWSFMGSVWCLVTVYSTIGYGNYTPQTEVGRILLCCLGTLGIPLFAYLAALSGQQALACSNKLWAKLAEFGLMGDPRLHNSGAGGWRGALSSALPLLGVLLAGVILCRMFDVSSTPSWEKDPNISETLYFCFLSMSTVGFGDQHPRIMSSTLKFVVFVLWLVLSVTITSAVVANATGKLASAHAGLLRTLFSDRGVDFDLAMAEAAHQHSSSRDEGTMMTSLCESVRETLDLPVSPRRNISTLTLEGLGASTQHNSSFAASPRSRRQAPLS